jgi:hypothetical protein
MQTLRCRGQSILFIAKNVFDEVRIGGPFGRHNQKRLARAMPNCAFQADEETFLDEIRNRQKFWDDCYPWTEGLAMLFDGVQQEVVSPFEALGDDGRRAECLLCKLSAFQRIAYEYLIEHEITRTFNSGPLGRALAEERQFHFRC